MKYVASLAGRKNLAREIAKTLESAGFTLIPSKVYVGTHHGRVHEDAYVRAIDEKRRVIVYTSISGGQIRPRGADAIRILSQRIGGDTERTAILVSETRVNRVGKVEAICHRMLTRMRVVWGDTKALGDCPFCNAPMAKPKDKSKKPYCAMRCWLRKDIQRPLVGQIVVFDHGRHDMIQKVRINRNFDGYEVKTFIIGEGRTAPCWYKTTAPGIKIV